MNSERKSAQMTLNVFGFVFVVLGLGLEGVVSFVCLGLAIALFVAALVVAATTIKTEDSDQI